MTDNVAVLDGYTVEIKATCDGCDLALLVKPGVDLDGSFKAWDMDEQEYLMVRGWLFTTELMEGKTL